MSRKKKDPVLLHHSKKPIKLADLTDTIQDQRGKKNSKSSIGKPNGFWISVEGPDDWKTWCEDNDFRLSNISITTLVRLKPDAKILWIKSVSELIEFQEKFGYLTYPEMPWWRMIDWSEVAQAHDGIIIAPYQWSMRLDDSSMWYYGWDCASGCIWNVGAIESLETVDDGEKKQEGKQD